MHPWHIRWHLLRPIKPPIARSPGHPKQRELIQSNGSSSYSYQVPTAVFASLNKWGIWAGPGYGEADYLDTYDISLAAYKVALVQDAGLTLARHSYTPATHTHTSRRHARVSDEPHRTRELLAHP